MFDNGKIRFGTHHNAITCELYTNDEITLDDIEWSLSIVQKEFRPPVKVIAIKSGNYWISTEAQMRMFRGFIEISQLAIVVTRAEDIRHTESASISFLTNMNVTLATSIEEAYEKLSQA